MQTFGVLKEVLKYHYHTYGLIMGGTNRQEEAKKLAKGINILVATPGRLLDHMQVKRCIFRVVTRQGKIKEKQNFLQVREIWKISKEFRPLESC